MGAPCESSLVAVYLPPPEAATAVRHAWDQKAAVAVIDPRASRHRLAAVLQALRPTHLVDGAGVQEMPEGTPVGNDVAAVVTTSGTTAEPRHVVLTRQAMEASARAVAQALGLVPTEDHWLACLPLHHIAGLAIVARSYFCDTALTVHPSFNAERVGSSADSATLVSLVPTMLTRLLETGAPLHRFRQVLLGGSSIPPSLLRRAEDATVQVTTTYGLSETGGGCTLDGKPVAQVDVSTRTNGEILVKGPVVMRGYLRDALATKRAFTSDGWLRTGDRGRIDANGLVEVVDRLKDIIVTGGINVSPTAVEQVLAEHSAVEDVCVVGAPDDEWGERVIAFVVARSDVNSPTLEELRSFGSERLAASQLPRELRLVSSIPRSLSGKALRRQLRR